MMRPDLERAVALVRKGHTYGEAAKAVGGITRSAVAGACSRAGVVTGRTFNNGSAANARRVVSLYKKGVNLDEIKRRCGLAPSCSIYSYLARAGIKANRRAASPSSKGQTE